MVDGRGKSDSSIVPGKLSNKAEVLVAERVEGRGLAKENLPESSVRRTQSRESASSAIGRVRQAARGDRRQKFTALLHHVYEMGRLREAYFALKHRAAAGVDGETWQHYGQDLEGNLRGLSARLRRGAYRAKPVRRAYIAKADGRQRALGVPVLEDKIVQRATVEVLNAIYEEDFVGFSYGFRPGRNQHQALDALAVGIQMKKVNWVLDADIRSFFDTLDHEWLVRFLEHRVGDRRVIRLVKKWLAAGVLEEGEWRRSEQGAAQGNSISPLLSNIYLHYAFDLWARRWRKTQARGDVIIVRFADDFIVGFEHRAESEQFLFELKERFRKFGLELHADKTRLIAFGRYAADRRRERGLGKPETFNFLGFTHVCGKTLRGGFVLIRQTMRKRFGAKLKEVYRELRRRHNARTPEQGAYLRSVVKGHMNYYGVPMNFPALQSFRYAVARLWKHALDRRSQRARVPWDRMKRLMEQWIPPAHICHPFPAERLGVAIRGRSRMR
jgi:RNA-directed DNA polymerase